MTSHTIVECVYCEPLPEDCVVSPVPLPAGGWLLLVTALAALRLFTRRKT